MIGSEMQKHPLTARDHKEIGRQLKRGVPFHRALRNVEGAMRPSRQRKSSPFGHLSSSNDSLEQAFAFLEAISAMFTIIAVLGLYQTYGFGLVGSMAVFGYLIGWEIVGVFFSLAEKRISSPLRILLRILEKILEIRS
jgi:hypothetical protein